MGPKDERIVQESCKKCVAQPPQASPAALKSAPADEMVEAEELAKFFHETYERLASEHGYETRKESAVPWEEVPENNKNLMIAVCQEALQRIRGKEDGWICGSCRTLLGLTNDDTTKCHCEDEHDREWMLFSEFLKERFEAAG
jgi:hypothetical protein